MKKTFIIIFIVVNIIVMNSCSDWQKNNGDNDENSTSLSEPRMDNINNDEDIMPLEASIIQLIANPSEYHGKKIMVKGIGNLKYEDTSVYLCIDSWYYLATKNALWVDIDLEVNNNELWFNINGKRISEKDAQKYNGKYVLIVGIFDMYETGHMDLFSGGIYDVTRFSDFSDIYRGMEMNPEDYYIGNVDDWFEGNYGEK